METSGTSQLFPTVSAASILQNLLKQVLEYPLLLIPANAIASLHGDARHSPHTPLDTGTAHLVIDAQAGKIAPEGAAHIPRLQPGGLAPDAHEPLVVGQVAALLEVAAEEMLDDARLGGRVPLLQGQGDELVGVARGARGARGEAEGYAVPGAGGADLVLQGWGGVVLGVSFVEGGLVAAWACV